MKRATGPRRDLARCCALVTLLAAVIVAGCGSSSDPAVRMALAALGTTPPQPPLAPPPGPVTHCRDVTASLRPPAVMPRPGAMPAGSFMARIKARGFLVAGVDQNTLLFAYFNPVKRRPEGFEIDLLHQVARAIFGNPNRVKFKSITPTERIGAVEHGSVDIVADAMTITCSRRRQVDFSTTYYDAGQRILVRSDSPIRNKHDLGGKRVCAAQGSTSIVELEQLRPAPKPVALLERIDCLVALQQGTIDAISTDDSILLGFKAQDPYTKIVGPDFTHEPYGMAISKAHPDFVRFVNGVLARLRADGQWQRIYARWLGKYARTPAPPRAEYVGPR